MFIEHIPHTEWIDPSSSSHQLDSYARTYLILQGIAVNRIVDQLCILYYDLDPGGVDYVDIIQQSMSLDFTFDSSRKKVVKTLSFQGCAKALLLTLPPPLLSPPFKRSPASSQQCTTISFISDDLVEDDETFHLLLNTTDERVMLYPATATVTITSNDGQLLNN